MMETLAKGGRSIVHQALPRPDVTDPGRWWHELREAHEMVREAIELKLQVARTPGFTATHCALVRWKMSRCRHRRSKSVAGAVAALLREATPAEAALLRHLQLEELGISRCCAAHLQRWTAAAIAQTPEDYTFAATEFCAAISERLTREGEILYPMLLARISRSTYTPREFARPEAWASSIVS